MKLIKIDCSFIHEYLFLDAMKLISCIFLTIIHRSSAFNVVYFNSNKIVLHRENGNIKSSSTLLYVFVIGFEESKSGVDVRRKRNGERSIASFAIDSETINQRKLD